MKKNVAILIWMIIIHTTCLSQSNDGEFKSYLKSINKIINFKKVKQVENLDSFLLFVPLNKIPTVYFLRINKLGYIGILDNFFINTKRKGYDLMQNKCLFVFLPEEKKIIIFMNGLANKKNITDSVVSEDLFAPDGSVEANVYDSLYNRVSKIYASPIGEINSKIRVLESKIIKDDYFTRFRDSKCNLFYYDFTKVSLFKLVENSLCILNESNFEKATKEWHLERSGAPINLKYLWRR